jgi:MFS family permease
VLTEADRRAGQRAMLWDGAFSQTMSSLTSGVILAGFALALGADDAAIGLLAAIPFLAQVAQLGAVAWMDRFGDRKALVVWGSVAARLLLLAMAALPYLGLDAPRVRLLLALLLAYAVLATLSGAAWQVWVRELVPRDRLGRYFGLRMAVTSAVGLVATLAAGALVSAWRGDALAPYALLFALGTAAGLASSGVLARAPAAEGLPVDKRSLLASLRAPLRDANARRVLLFLGAWGFAANLALPFVSVVLLRTLGYSVLLVAALSASSQLAYILGLRLWAPLTDRFGNRPVLGLAGSVFVVIILLWALVPKIPGLAILAAAALLHLVLGFANAGLDVASNGLVMRLPTSEAEAPAFLAGASIVKSLASGAAPLLGGLAASTWLAGRTLRVDLSWIGPGASHAVTALQLTQHDFLFLASALVGLYALHRLLGFHEQGEARPVEVARAMRREIGSPNTIAGARAFAHVASYLVEAAYRFAGSDRREALVGASREPEGSSAEHFELDRGLPMRREREAELQTKREQRVDVEDPRDHAEESPGIRRAHGRA